MSDAIFKLRVLRILLASAYRDWVETVGSRDPDSQYCCDGRECCCGGETIRQLWSWELRKDRS